MKWIGQGRYIIHYSDMATRLSDEHKLLYIFGDAFFVSRSLLGIERQKRLFKKLQFWPEASDMVATGQEIVREKKILQGQGKVREFHFESGKIYIFEKSQGKVKF